MQVAYLGYVGADWNHCGVTLMASACTIEVTPSPVTRVSIIFETAIDAYGAPQQILTVNKNDPLHAADPPVASSSAFIRANISHADGRLESYQHDDPRVMLSVRSGPVTLDGATRVLRASGGTTGPAEVCATFSHVTDLPATCILFQVVKSGTVGVRGLGWPDPTDLTLEKNDVRPIGASAVNARAVMQPLVFNVSVLSLTLHPEQ